jgi:1-acyl-sn-glycerol-3-phosphate acyltransferase
MATRRDPPAAARLRLHVQRAISFVLAPLWLAALVAWLRFVAGYRIADVAAVRAQYRKLRRDGGPLLVCPNHRTMMDSALVAWALGSPATFLRDFGALPWNLPDRIHFASRWWSRAAVYVLKCLPVDRGGSRAALASVLEDAAWLLRRGEALLVFPEGRRSRSGRVEQHNKSWGPGRLIAAAPGCRVLCVHLRGEHATALGFAPPRGERFHVRLDCFAPRAEQAGLRGSLDLTQQVIARLAALEALHFGEAAA